MRGVVVGAALVVAVAVVLLPLRDDVDPATPTAVLVVTVIIAALVGGLLSALATALIAGLALNLAFLRPYGTLKIRALEDGIGLAAFVVVAVLVGTLAATMATRRRESEERATRLQALLAEREELLRAATRAHDLARLDAERSALLRSVSHDLRTPLSAIRAVATDLRDGTTYDDATRAELLDIVCDETERLDRMVANLLSMSRIESGPLELQHQAVDVGDLIRGRITTLHALLRPFEVQIRVPDRLPLVDGDELLLGQVLTNLIANAVRHTPERSDIWLVATHSVDHDGHGWVKIEVSDRGPGIPAAERARVFLPFQRGEGSRSSGVGLAICKAIVEAHGGHIWIEDRFGGGTTVAFTIPARQEVPR